MVGRSTGVALRAAGISAAPRRVLAHPPSNPRLVCFHARPQEVSRAHEQLTSFVMYRISLLITCTQAIKPPCHHTSNLLADPTLYLLPHGKIKRKLSPPTKHYLDFGIICVFACQSDRERTERKQTAKGGWESMSGSKVAALYVHASKGKRTRRKLGRKKKEREDPSIWSSEACIHPSMWAHVSGRVRALDALLCVALHGTAHLTWQARLVAHAARHRRRPPPVPSSLGRWRPVMGQTRLWAGAVAPNLHRPIVR